MSRPGQVVKRPFTQQQDKSVKPYQHQIDIFNQALPILRQHNLVCLSLEERTGKTLISLMLSEAYGAEQVLIVTKKKAIPGWQDHLDKAHTTKEYTLTNYHQLPKLEADYDLVIYDEAHYVLSGFPKPGMYQQAAKAISYNCPCIYLSATFSAQSFSQLYHIFDTTKYSPWSQYKSFYRWAADHVDKYTIKVNNRDVNKYDRTKPGVYESVEHLFISYTREELGFKHEPEDIKHYVELSASTNEVMEILKRDRVYGEYVADTPTKLMSTLHQLEGKGWEKINYILDHFGDNEDVVIFAHYIEEQKRLSELFNFATVLSSTAYSEGVDLHQYKTAVIYSMGFSTSQYTQRRCRQANMKREDPIDVHYLLTKDGISEAVYNAVAINKKNFVARYYHAA